MHHRIHPDIRELRVGQLVADDTGKVFILDRAKSRRAAAATLTVWSEAILNHTQDWQGAHASYPLGVARNRRVLVQR